MKNISNFIQNLLNKKSIKEKNIIQEKNHYLNMKRFSFDLT